MFSTKKNSVFYSEVITSLLFVHLKLTTQSTIVLNIENYIDNFLPISMKLDLCNNHKLL